MQSEQREFLNHLDVMCQYWAAQGGNEQSKLDGLAFSILVALDGGAAVGPYSVRPENESGSPGPQIAGCLHEFWHSVCEENRAKGKINF